MVIKPAKHEKTYTLHQQVETGTQQGKPEAHQGIGQLVSGPFLFILDVEFHHHGDKIQGYRNG